MNHDEWIKLAAAAALIVMQAYAVQPWKYPVLALFWDWVARITGQVANRLGWISVNARANYYLAVETSGA